MKKVNPELIDADNPAWTPSMLSGAKRFSELPASLRAKLSKNQEKIATTISLSPDVLSGTGSAAMLTVSLLTVSFEKLGQCKVTSRHGIFGFEQSITGSVAPGCLVAIGFVLTCRFLLLPPDGIAYLINRALC